VENLELGHHLSSVAHLGNTALRSGHKIVLGSLKEQIVGDAEADKLVGVDYRATWKLPYYPRA
jgi:hypothetical protein